MKPRSVGVYKCVGRGQKGKPVILEATLQLAGMGLYLTEILWSLVSFGLKVLSFTILSGWKELATQKFGYHTNDKLLDIVIFRYVIKAYPSTFRPNHISTLLDSKMYILFFHRN